MKKGIRAHDVFESGFENICKKCKNNGISYLQLVLEKTVEGFEYGKFSKEYAKSIKSQLGETKIAVLGSYVNLSSSNENELKEAMLKFKEKIKYASILKPGGVGSETGFFGTSLSENENESERAYLHLLKNVKELVCYAEKFGVNIGIEGVHCFVINTPEKMSRLLSDIDSKNLKVIFDPVNYININNFEKQDEMIKKSFELFADKMAAFHMKDFVVIDGKIKNVVPGKGILNYKLIFEKFKEYNLDIPIISEEIEYGLALDAFEFAEGIAQNKQGK